MKEELILPTEIRKATQVNPKNLIIYGLPKSGKTTAISKLENNLIIDLEKGSGFIDGMVIEPPDKLGPVGRFGWLKDLSSKIKENYPYDYVTIDTLSQLDVESEWVGTYNYMNTIQGGSFNRETDSHGVPIKNGKKLKPDDSNYESVHSLANGYGYRYSREVMLDIFDSLKNLGKICTIFVCHVSDKMIAKNGGGEVMTKDLALTGKVRDLLPRMVDATANVWNDNGKFMVSFRANENKIGGVRSKHLVGFEGELEWDKIFI